MSNDETIIRKETYMYYGGAVHIIDKKIIKSAF